MYGTIWTERRKKDRTTSNIIHKFEDKTRDKSVKYWKSARCVQLFIGSEKPAAE